MPEAALMLLFLLGAGGDTGALGRPVLFVHVAAMRRQRGIGLGTMRR